MFWGCQVTSLSQEPLELLSSVLSLHESGGYAIKGSMPRADGS
jgi:hypothetical protein